MTPEINLLDYDRQSLEHYLTELEQREFRARQLLRWIHRRGEHDFGRMTNIQHELRTQLKERACIKAPELEREQVSTDGVHKFWFRLEDGGLVESVLIPEPRRTTLCISSQVGCPLDCRFCATGAQGFQRNLSAAEIIGQLWRVNRLPGLSRDRPQRISNVVFMGMGEPLLNLDNVQRAVALLLDEHAYGLPRRRVTISTAGLVPGIRNLARTCPVSLAVSLHAADDELRSQLVPLNRRYPLEELLHACALYCSERNGEAITFEYTMLRGINDSPAAARLLAERVRGIPCKLNLIPFNPFPGNGFECSTAQSIARFREILLQSGYVVTVRKTRGADIGAACGQLTGQFTPRAVRHRRRAGQPQDDPVRLPL